MLGGGNLFFVLRKSVSGLATDPFLSSRIVLCHCHLIEIILFPHEQSVSYAINIKEWSWFYCFTMHFNSLNVTHQLMHFQYDNILVSSVNFKTLTNTPTCFDVNRSSSGSSSVPR